MYSLVPSGPPTNVRVAVLSASSVNVTWDDPLPDKRNGVIRKFTISYDCSDDNNNNTCPDYAPITSKEKHYQIINGLHPYTEYLFAVAARTEIGEGPFSFAVYVMTLEAGELNYVCSVRCHPYPNLNKPLPGY